MQLFYGVILKAFQLKVPSIYVPLLQMSCNLSEECTRRYLIKVSRDYTGNSEVISLTIELYATPEIIWEKTFQKMTFRVLYLIHKGRYASMISNNLQSRKSM